MLFLKEKVAVSAVGLQWSVEGHVVWKPSVVPQTSLVILGLGDSRSCEQDHVPLLFLACLVSFLSPLCMCL